MVKRQLKVLKPYLADTFHVRELGVFGSYVRSEENRKSDLDILIALKRPIGLIEFIRLENFLSKSLGVKVDLVMKGALKPRIGRNIMNEVVMI